MTIAAGSPGHWRTGAVSRSRPRRRVRHYPAPGAAAASTRRADDSSPGRATGATAGPPGQGSSIATWLPGPARSSWPHSRPSLPGPRCVRDSTASSRPTRARSSSWATAPRSSTSARVGSCSTPPSAPSGCRSSPRWTAPSSWPATRAASPAPTSISCPTPTCRHPRPVPDTAPPSASPVDRRGDGARHRDREAMAHGSR